MRSRNVLRADRRRRQHLLPRQARRHPASRRAGHRRAADGHEQGRLQGDAARRGEIGPWPRYSAQSPARTSRPSAARSPRACSRTPTSSRSSTASRRCTRGSPRRSPTSRRLLQRPRPQFLPRQAADVRRRRGARVPQCRRGLGHPDGAAVQGRPGAVVAPDRFAGGRRVRHHDVPGDAGRPRADAADGAAVAGRRRMAGAHRADRDEPRPAPAAVAAPQLPPRPGGGPRARGVGRGRARRWCWAPAASRTSSTASAPASSTSRST